jgi:hypothetical protein
MMMPRTKLGRLRAVVLNLSAREFAERLTASGCPITLRHLRGIELSEVKPTEQERQAIAAALGVESWEVQL